MLVKFSFDSRKIPFPVKKTLRYQKTQTTGCSGKPVALRRRTFSLTKNSSLKFLNSQ